MPSTFETSSFMSCRRRSLQYMRRSVSIYTSTSSQSEISTMWGRDLCCFDHRSDNFAAKNRLCATSICRCTLNETVSPSLEVSVRRTSLESGSLNWLPGLQLPSNSATRSWRSNCRSCARVGPDGIGGGIWLLIPAVGPRGWYSCSFAIMSNRVGLDLVLSSGNGGGDMGLSKPALSAELNLE